jgi:single-stranded DNA-specific DHH superfamily exonuclease
MLTEKQIKEIREHLESSQNPLFFFDNDNDGLTSFLLLRRFLDRGKGVAAKGSHSLEGAYYRKVNELNPDKIFMLDVSGVSDEFLEKAEEENVPVIWIDHHDVPAPTNKNVSYYNPFHNDKTNEPVSYLCQKIANQKQDIWLAVIGCISDYYIPDFYEEFQEKFPDLAYPNPKVPFDVLYKSEIGKIARILDSSLKNTTTNVLKMMRFMSNAKGPLDILEENYHTKHILQRFKEIDSKYQGIMERIRKLAKDKIIFFTYSGELSMSSNLSNQISYEYPEKVIVIAYIKGDISNLSIRGNFVDVKEMTLKAIEGLEGSRGGGHKHSTGARVNTADLDTFKQRFEDMLDEQKQNQKE